MSTLFLIDFRLLIKDMFVLDLCLDIKVFDFSQLSKFMNMIFILRKFAIVQHNKRFNFVNHKKYQLIFS